jgi:hypothetical protein
LRIHADLESDRVRITGIEPGTRLRVTLLARDGSVLAQVVHQVTPETAVIQLPLLETGMRVVARNSGRNAEMPVGDVVPRIDRSTDVLSGRAPPGSIVKVEADHFPRAGESGRPIRRTFDIGPSGRWRWDIGSQLDILGGDGVFVVVQTRQYTLAAVSSVPFMAATLNSSAVYACDLDHDRPAGFTLRDGTGTIKATATWAFGERCHRVLLRDAQWRPRPVRSGDTLTGDFSTDAVLLTEPTRLHADASEDTAHGRCPQPGWWSVLGSDDRSASGTTTDGRFSVAAPKLGDLHAGQFVAVTCTPMSGDSLAAGAVAEP